MIAMALACEPKLLIADEPTTALDVTIQAQILDLLRALDAERDTALIMITHDLGVVAGICERVEVMYAGTFVESGTAEQIFAAPRHPYTRGLLESVPRLDTRRAARAEPDPRISRATCSKRRRRARSRRAAGCARSAATRERRCPRARARARRRVHLSRSPTTRERSRGWWATA